MNNTKLGKILGSLSLLGFTALTIAGQCKVGDSDVSNDCQPFSNSTWGTNTCSGITNGGPCQTQNNFSYYTAVKASATTGYNWTRDNKCYRYTECPAEDGINWISCFQSTSGVINNPERWHLNPWGACTPVTGT